MANISTLPIPQANIYILQGDDELSIRDYLQEFTGQISEKSPGDLDITYLDGKAANRSEITQALNSLSLLSPQRVVVLEQALDALGTKESQVWLAEMLQQLPDSTLLVLLVPDSQRYRKGEMVWEKVGKKHWLRKSLLESGKKIEWQGMPLPSQRVMPGWIMAEAERQGGKGRFDGRAAAELANLVGNNLFQARQEIAKALSYVGTDGVVSREDVRLLCSQSREEDIFAMVDAVGTRNAKRALGLLQHLLQDMPAQYIYTMLARQVRILVMAKEVVDGGGKQNDLATRAHLHAFVAKKAIAQCRHFSMGELEGLYRQLDRMDEDAKTGNVTLEVAMETLIANIVRGR